MQLSEDSFRALARSSPWRFTRLHFIARGFHPGDVEAWLTRPGRLQVVYDGREHEVVEDRRESTAVLGFSASAVEGPPDSALELGSVVQRMPVHLPHEVAPTLRPDGLVAERPVAVAYDDPMWQSYRWVAALDPVELAVGTDLAELREQPRNGRPTWWASVRPAEGYEPRCECCTLLPNPLSDEREGRVPRPEYPSSYTVGLDVATGVVVALEAVGGDLGYSPDFELEIVAAG